MPTIDTSAIEGFDALTPEQKVNALLKVDIPEKVDLSGYVKKDVFDAKASEAAELSKKLKGKLTDEEAAKLAAEQANAETQKQIEELTEKLAAAEKRELVAGYKARYLATPGFDEKLAEETAKALADGDMEKVFANQQKANEAHEKALKAEWVKADPKPGGKGDEGGSEPDNVARAREMGKQRAEAMKASKDIFGHFKI